jgi:hypothetical protein
MIPARLPKSEATKLGATLVSRKLLRPVRSKPGAPIWREEAAGKSISLVITRAGRAAIGAIADRVRSEIKNEKQTAKAAGSANHVKVPRAGTKQALVVDMLSKEQGATIDSLAKATGWLPHTTRAALTGLRKKGFGVERFSIEGSGLFAYRLVSATTQEI